MKAKILLSLLFTLCASSLWAYDVEVDGIYYNLDSEGSAAIVTHGDNKYSGDIVIPSTIEVEGISYSVTSIGEGVFWGCSGLTSISIPNSVTSIGAGAFGDCISLNSVLISDYVACLEDIVFWNCTSLTSVAIPNGVTSIKPQAFANSGLTSISLPNSVTSIGYWAFSGCRQLTSITIPNSVTSIGEAVFSYCTALASIKVDEDNSFYDSRDNCNAIITKTSVGEVPANTLIAGCCTTTIPNSVTSIGVGAFVGHSRLTSIIIPNGVTSIGDQAFDGCTVSSITIPNSVTSIGDFAFRSCGALASIKVDEDNSFYDSRDNCNAIITKTLVGEVPANTLIAGCCTTTIPNSVTSIGVGAFDYCSSLTNITIPNSVTSIGDFAFRSCTVLTTITIPNSVTSIGESVFDGCRELASISIPNSVTSIGDFAFHNCVKLTTMTIPNSVTSIGYCAFSGLNSLEELYCYSKTVPSTPFEIFDGVPDITHCTLYVPAAAIDSYKSSAQWKDFGTIKAIPGLAHKLTYQIDGETYKEYNVEEDAAITPEAEPTKTGYTFSGWSEIPSTMPAEDVIITAKWTINSYKLTYKVDNEAYKESTVEYNSAISPLAAPEKEGYTFSGWSEIPKNMPANDVVVTGSFTINQYTVKFVADGVTIKEDKFDYGSAITAPANPTKDGSVFKGWNPEVDKTVPSHDVTYTALFESVSGIDDIFLNAETVKVHSIIGQLIKSNATKEDVNSLPSGIYIINGKKVTLR